MATPTSGAVPVARGEPRTRTTLLLEAIALRHQIALLERSRTRRPYFRRIDRLFWILLSRWWPLILLLLLAGALTLGADFGGRMVYDYNAGGNACPQPIPYQRQ